MKTTTFPLKHSMNRSPLRVGFLFTALTFLVSSQLSYSQCPQTCDTDRNTALGDGALLRNTGIDNTAVGAEALQLNTGDDNTALGSAAMEGNQTGSFNTAIGGGVLASSIGGSFNTAVGHAAMDGANVTGSGNIALGSFAGLNIITGNDNIDIGNQGVTDESGVIRIGTEGTQTATYIAGVRGTPLATGAAVAVGITADGQLGVRTSSARFKEAIKPMDKGSEAIFSLQPVSFRYKNDPAALPQFGLVAEEVAKVNRNLVTRDTEGKPFTVRYDEINVMLLNEFLKEHRKVKEQEATITQLKKDFGATIARLTTRLDEQAAQIQKVSAQLEASRATSETVLNNH
jgi:Chaperone of endosialidase